MTKRSGYFLFGAVAALAMSVLALGLSGAPDEAPAPQYTADEVTAHFLKQQEAARNGAAETKVEAARKAEDPLAARDAARTIELQDQADEPVTEAPIETAEDAEVDATVEPSTETTASETDLTASAKEEPAKPSTTETQIVLQEPSITDEPGIAQTAALPTPPSVGQTGAGLSASSGATAPSQTVGIAKSATKSEAPSPTQPATPNPAPPVRTPTATARLSEMPKRANGPKVVSAAPSKAKSAKPTTIAKSEFPKSASRSVAATGTTERPRFPWPPPQASTVVRLPLSRFETQLTRQVHGEVADLLEGALDQSAYFDRSYWVAPGGFALVTRLERITEDGDPVKAEDRWPTQTLRERFDLGQYLRALFYTDPGFFRVIVFVLSTEFERTSDEEPTPNEAFRWLRRGMVMLPRDMAQEAITAQHELTALIYEFEREAGSDAIVLAPGRLSGRTHLARARLDLLLGSE